MQITYPNLPIVTKKDEIIEALKTNQVLVVAADTGSGKSTQLPKFCLQAGLANHGTIAMVQPRRIGAISIASRIAWELGVPLGGDEVGYRIRFDDKSRAKSAIRIMTDGLLLTEFQSDHNLSQYSTIIVDEAHERSLNIDLLLGLLRMLVIKRPNLKVIISSATLDTQKFSHAFNNCPIIMAEGRLFPVDLQYRPPENNEGDLQTQALTVLNEILTESHSGDILVFMPTEEEITNFIESAKGITCKYALLFLPLFARLSPGEQQRIFQNFNGRKIVVSTNLAETTLTIPGIRYVIDSGFARLSQYDTATRIQSLPIVPISQASANQRKGRCGRLSDGVCYRLYSEEDFNSRAPFTPPEISRSNLTETVLRMIMLNIKNITQFPFIDAPKEQFFTEAFKTLFELGATRALLSRNTKNDKHLLTPIGRFMSTLPVDPRLSRVLAQAKEEGVLTEAVVVCSALSIQDIRLRPTEKKAQADLAHKVFIHKSSDFLFYINLYYTAIEPYQQSNNSLRKFCTSHFLHYNRMREWFSLIKQLTTALHLKNSLDNFTSARLAELNQTESNPFIALHKSIFAGFVQQFALLKPQDKPVAKRPKKANNCYTMVGGKEMVVFPSSALFNAEQTVIFSSSLVRTKQVYGRLNAICKLEWLMSLTPHLIRYKPDKPHFSLKKGEVVCFEKGFCFGIQVTEGQLVAYKKYEPVLARDMFIKEALLQPTDELQDRFTFIKTNQQFYASLEKIEHKIRKKGYFGGVDALFSFYQTRLNLVAGFVDLEQFIAKQGDGALFIKEEDLLIHLDGFKATEYPDCLEIDGKTYPLSYAFNPAGDNDGQTLLLEADEVGALKNATLWPTKAFLQEKIEAIIKALDKAYRVQLHPINATATTIASEIERHGNFFESLQYFVTTHYNVNISAKQWQQAEAKIAPYLRLRYAVKKADGTIAVASRNLTDLATVKVEGIDQTQLAKHQKGLELFNLTHFPAKTIEKVIVLPNGQGRVYPALTTNGNNDVDLKLYTTLTEAEVAHPVGVSILIQKIIKKPLTTLKEEAVFNRDLPALAYFGGSTSYSRLWWQAFLARHLTLTWYSPSEWEEVEQPSFVQNLWQQMTNEKQATLIALNYYVQIRELLTKFDVKYAYLKKQWQQYRCKADSLLTFSPSQNSDMVLQLGRYLKSLFIQAERMAINPSKEEAKLANLKSKWAQWHSLNTVPNKTYGQQQNSIRAYFLLIEFDCKILTPELKTTFKLNSEELDTLLQP